MYRLYASRPYLCYTYRLHTSTLAIPICYTEAGSKFAISIGFMQEIGTQGGIKKAMTEDEIEIQGRKFYLFTVVIGG